MRGSLAKYRSSRGGHYASCFEREAAEWRAKEEGARLPQRARRAPDLFARQEPGEKRMLLDFVLSNCTGKDGKSTVAFRRPHDLLAVTHKAIQKKEAAGASSGGPRPEMLPD